MRQFILSSPIGLYLLLAPLSAGCQSVLTPSDDPMDWDVDTSVQYTPVVSEISWAVPSENLPSETEALAANNNVDIHLFDGRLFLAWRTAPNHFASDQAAIVVISSTDRGSTWEFEARFHLGTDLREPRLYHLDDQLHLLFFQGGTNPLAFEPQRVWKSTRDELNDWAAPQVHMEDPEVPWDIKLRFDSLFMTSYIGDHYSGEADAQIDVLFRTSSDGESWSPAGEQPIVYSGGVSEVAFEFMEDGTLWAITRNEDGDSSGFGSHLCSSHIDHLDQWDCPSQSDPERYDSPEMFRHGDDLYLLARRDIDGPFGETGSLAEYSLRPKRSSLYRINRQERAVQHILDIPGVGDTAFPAVRRTGAHTFLFANYTSPLDDPDITWLEGQTGSTHIYLATLLFVPVP